MGWKLPPTNEGQRMRRCGQISLTIALMFVSTCIRAQEAKPVDAAAATTTPSAQAELLTLQQAIAGALANNRQIKIFDENVLISNDEILAARTQRYPHFSVDVTGSGLLTPVTVEFPRGVFGNVGSTPVPSAPTAVTTDPKFSALSIVQQHPHSKPKILSKQRQWRPRLRPAWRVLSLGTATGHAPILLCGDLSSLETGWTERKRLDGPGRVALRWCLNKTISS